jgi:6-phosphogluconolactonase (cycloisomerase 2 family)
MQVNAAGDLVAIGNQDSGTVVIVSRDPATGVLGAEVASVSVGPIGVDGVGGLSSVAWAE